MTKLNYDQLIEVIKKCDNDNDLKQMLQYIFSFPENIDIFSKFFFPHAIIGGIPEFHYQVYTFLFDDDNGALGAPRGHGKAQGLNSKILTVDGWKKIKDLKIGDSVFSQDGLPTKIIQLHPIQIMDLYNVTTRDGRTTNCNLEHLWNVECPSNTGHKIITKATKEIIKNYKSERYDKRNGKQYVEYRYFLPVCEPIQFLEKNLPIDPYTLGIWLGDGTSKSSTITSADPEIFEYIPYTTEKTKTHLRYTIKGLFRLLRTNNLLGNKHIPQIYLNSSIKQRMELLQGLMDTDGCISTDGMQISFTNTNKNLIDGFVYLVRSLGGTATQGDSFNKSHQNSKIFHSYRVTARIPRTIKPCKLKRKLAKWKGSIKTKSAIVDISYSHTDFGRCISVEHPSGTYITDDFMITHNSTITGLVFLTYCIVNNLEKYIVYVSQNHAKTVQFLDPLRHEFKNNNKLRWVYGDLTPKSGKDDEGRDREDCFDVNSIRIEAVSFEKNLRGFKYIHMRPTLIILDDIEEDERTLNPELRLKDEHKLNKVIIPSLDIDGRIKMIGTLLHYDSLLAKKINEYNGKIFRACDENFENILWAERFTKDKLMKIKTDIGSISFQQEFLNDPIDTTISIIKRDWVDACKRNDVSYDDLKPNSKDKKYQFNLEGTDFAFSDRVTADESAFVSIGVKDDFYYVFDIYTPKGLSVYEQLNYIKNDLHPKYNYDQVGLEENSIKAVSKDLSQYNLPITLFWLGSTDPSTSRTEYNDYDFFGKRHTVGKINMILRLATAFENKRFILPYKTETDKRITDKLVSECISFALNNGKLVESGVHPNIPIALGYCLEMANSYKGIAFNFG